MTTARYRRTTVAIVAIGAVLASALAATAPADAAPPRPIHPATSTTTDNPWTYQLTNAGSDGLVVRGVQNGTAQLVQVFDYAGNPIFTIPPFGGPAVLGDNLRIFHPGSVFSPALVLRYDGSLALGQQVGSDAAPIQQGGPSIYGGSADPNVKPPAHQQTASSGQVVNRPLVVGDWYLRSGAGYGLYVWTGSTWARKL